MVYIPPEVDEPYNVLVSTMKNRTNRDIPFMFRLVRGLFPSSDEEDRPPAPLSDRMVLLLMLIGGAVAVAYGVIFGLPPR